MEIYKKIGDEWIYEIFKKDTHKEAETSSSDLTSSLSNLTFNLFLTEEQKTKKSQVELPHMRAQQLHIEDQTSLIWYDSEEEDPDADLEI
jgi:hypothetical protein